MSNETLTNKARVLLRQIRRVGYPAQILCYRNGHLEMIKDVLIDPVNIDIGWLNAISEGSLEIKVIQLHHVGQE